MATPGHDRGCSGRRGRFRLGMGVVGHRCDLRRVAASVYADQPVEILSHAAGWTVGRLQGFLNAYLEVSWGKRIMGAAGRWVTGAKAARRRIFDTPVWWHRRLACATGSQT